MKDDAIRRELDDLREQLMALKEERESYPSASSTASDEGPASAEQPLAGGAVDGVEVDPEAGSLTEQFQELLDGLDRDLRDTSPSTLLAVFALGVLVGRLLPR